MKKTITVYSYVGPIFLTFNTIDHSIIDISPNFEQVLIEMRIIETTPQGIFLRKEFHDSNINNPLAKII